MGSKKTVLELIFKIVTSTISSELRRDSVEFKAGTPKLVHLLESRTDFSFRSNPSELAVLLYEINQTIETIHYLSDKAHPKAILYGIMLT